VLLLPSGCVPDDKRDEEEDEEADLPRGHRPPKLVKKRVGTEAEREAVGTGRVLNARRTPWTLKLTPHRAKRS